MRLMWAWNLHKEHEPRKRPCEGLAAADAAPVIKWARSSFSLGEAKLLVRALRFPHLGCRGTTRNPTCEWGSPAAAPWLFTLGADPEFEFV